MSSIKQYLVFSGMTYYPKGGMDDCTMRFDANDDLEAAQKAVNHLMPDGPDWIQVCRLQVSGTLVKVFEIGGKAKENEDE